jgi:AraC-like DNA-binding protein
MARRLMNFAIPDRVLDWRETYPNGYFTCSILAKRVNTPGGEAVCYFATIEYDHVDANSLPNAPPPLAIAARQSWGRTIVEGQQRVGPMVEVPEVLRELGKDPTSVIAAAGVDPNVLRNPENVLSFLEVGRLFQACVAATDCQHFGLLVGQRSATTSLGLVGRLMRNAATLKDAIVDLCCHQQRYIRGSVIYLIVRNQIAFWGYAVHHPGMQAIEQLGDGAAAVGFNMMKELTGITPDEVYLSRHAPSDVGPYRRVFGMLPRFNAEQNALAFSASVLAHPVRDADRDLRVILEKKVAAYWTVKQPDIMDQIIRILRPRVVFADTSLADVATDLSMHRRTLNRRLQARGTSFRQLLQEARFEAAKQLLAATRMDVSDIALALDYADPSSFVHAFQRWSGTTPSKWRAVQQILE